MEIDFIIDPHNSNIHTIVIMDWKLIHHSLDNNSDKNINTDFKDAFQIKTFEFWYDCPWYCVMLLMISRHLLSLTEGRIFLDN